MNIAIIPARGGSKRIPRKNIKLFHGHPVIAYAIKAAKESRVFDEVLVSTDDSEIAEIARKYDAKVPWVRPKHLADDSSTTLEVIQDAVKKLDVNSAESNNICCIYPVTPLLKPEFLTQGLSILMDGDWDYVISASKVSAPPERLLTLGENREIVMRFPEHEFSRTQDIPFTYHDAGQFYWGKKISWESALPLFTSKSTIFELPEKLAVDVDTLADWHYAEYLFSNYGKDLN
jgi:N-acylneuraminate cytidylyltransferase